MEKSFEERKEAYTKEYKKYFAVYENAVFIEYDSLEEISILPNVQWIFEQKLIDYYRTSWPTDYIAVEFKCIDNHGTPILFSREKIKGLSFKQAIEGSGPYHIQTSLTIMDADGTARKIARNVTKFSSFIKDLFEVFDDLVLCKNWITYDILKENRSLKIENEALKKKLNETPNHQ